MKILCVGHVTYDIKLSLDNYPIENNKYNLTNSIESAGGGPVNASFLLAKWGMQYDTYFAGVIGNDNHGNKIKKEFTDMGLSTKFIETTYEYNTSLSLILVNQNNGSRTIFNLNEAYIPLKKLNLDFIPDVILMDGYDYHSSRALLDKFPNSIAVIDASNYNENTIGLCKSCKYIIAAADFAEKITKKAFNYENQKSLVEIYSALTDIFSRSEIIITLGEHGVLYNLNGNIRLIPAIKVEAKDTTGAGDIFHGAFVYGLSNNFDFEKNIKYANIAAGLSVTKLDIKKAIPTLEEVNKYYEEH